MNDYDEMTAPHGGECWWSAKDSEQARGAMWKAYEVAKAYDRERADKYRAFRNVYSHGVHCHDVVVGDMTVASNRQNLSASLVDTAATKLIDHRPNPMAVTAGGNAKAQQQARALSKWTSAAAKSKSCHLHKTVEAAAMEAFQVGTGAFRVFERAGRPASEVAYCDHIYVDPLEAYNNAVLTYYQERYVDRAELARRYPKAKDHIRRAEPARSSDAMGSAKEYPGTSNMVLVVQAWRCALSDDPEHVGRFIVGTSSGVLVDEEYDSEDAPFTFIRWRPQSRGFWGIGLVEMSIGLQEQIDRHTETVDETLDALPPAIFAQEGSIKREQMDNGIARLFSYKGPNPPTLWAPGASAVDGHARREERLTEIVYQLAGVSSMEAGAQKPAGLDSGRALLVHQDVKSQRLLMQARSIEDAYTDAFDRLVQVADQIWEKRKDDTDAGADRMRYLAGEGEDVEELAYADARIAEAMYRIEIFPVSKLADSPEGLFTKSMEMSNGGLLSPEETLELMDFPDVRAAVDARTSTRKWARRIVDSAIDGKDAAYLVTADDDLQEIARYGRQMRAKALLNGSTHDSLDRLSEVLGAVTTLQRQMAAAAEAAAAEAAPPPAPMGPPAAAPGAPPMPGPMPGPPVM